MVFTITRKHLFVVLGLVFVLALVAGAFFMGRVSTGGSQDEASGGGVAGKVSSAEENTEVVQEVPAEALSPEAQFAKEFETFLNNFLKELSQLTVQYKKDRRILKEAVDPFNLIGTENAEQSYRLFRDEIGPLLRKKGEGVIAIFGKSEKVVQALLVDKSPETQKMLLAAWKKLEQEHMNGLLDYFENEDRLIHAHEALLKFYFIHSKLYAVDVATGKIVFTNEKYAAREKALLDKIKKIRGDARKKKSP